VRGHVWHSWCMSRKVLPQGKPKRQRYGECSLCGMVTKLSKTHVPPKAAGNSGPARVAVEVVEDGISRIGLGTPKDGGMWGWWFCEGCNGITRRWDEEFMGWSIPLLLKIQEERRPIGVELYYEQTDGDPGAFVRELWAWAFAIDERLHTEYPAVAEAVRNGHATEPPDDHRMLLAVTSDLRIWVAGQRGGAAVRTSTQALGWHRCASGLVLPGPEFLPIPRVAVAAPPFVALLAESRDDPGLRLFDTGDWLKEPPGSRRPIYVPLTTVRALGDAGALALVTYEELAS
jgi:hypothetical protein